MAGGFEGGRLRLRDASLLYSRAGWCGGSEDGFFGGKCRLGAAFPLSSYNEGLGGGLMDNNKLL